MILVVVGDVVVIQVDCKWGEWDVIVYWRSGGVIRDGVC